MTQPSVLFSQLADAFASLGRTIGPEQSLEQALQTIAHCALTIVPEAKHAAISRVHDGRVETVAATGEVPARLDQLQNACGGGPVLDVSAGRRAAIRVGDLSTSERWPEFGVAAADHCGVRSLVCVRMASNDPQLSAALCVYATGVDAFGEWDELATDLLAMYGSLIVTAAERRQKAANLERALQTNRRIAMAIGVLMATRKLTETQAFDLLRTASQSRHRKLYQLADEVVETGQLDTS